MASFERGDPTLPNGSYFHPYKIQGQRGQFVDIEMFSNDFDPVLILVHRDSERLVSQNDSLANRNRSARLQTRLPLDGEYIVLALTYDTEATGNYELNVSLDR